MFFILSKTLYYFLMPVTWFILLALLALFTKKVIRKKRYVQVLVLLIIITSNPLISNELMLLWEIPPRNIESIENYDVGILLTGITQMDKSPKDRVYFLKGADRVSHTVQLYKLGKIKKILISGTTNITWDGTFEKMKAHPLEKVLLLYGVPQKDISWENQSRNTYENAVYSKIILQNTFPNQKYLLISSAFHLRRAQKCFEKQGIKIDTFSTDFYTSDRHLSPRSFLPSEYSLLTISILSHELMGYLTYKLMGYL
jgi:uncharacterized SAM-binding protein YcdF (DUF218 family)